MKEIYQNALRKARQKVFDDESGKYEKIIAFCKYKLDANIYTRNETTKRFANGREIQTDIFITTEKANNFDEYIEKQTNNKTIYNFITIGG